MSTYYDKILKPVVLSQRQIEHALLPQDMINEIIGWVNIFHMERWKSQWQSKMKSVHCHYKDVVDFLSFHVNPNEGIYVKLYRMKYGSEAADQLEHDCIHMFCGRRGYVSSIKIDRNGTFTFNSFELSPNYFHAQLYHD